MHLDMNSYFATVEQQANPYLRDKPVGILKAEGRTCIIAASKEAKIYGVKTGSTVWEAMRLCPKIVLVPADMHKYLAVTKRLIALISDYSPLVEVFSIDEMFLDVCETQKLFEGGALGIGIEIKERIKEEIGSRLTCSVGISYNKLLAKLAGEQMKPDGLFVIDSGNLDAVYAKAKLQDVCGIGPRIERRLRGLGIINLLQIRKVPKNVLLGEFGEYWTEFLLNTAWGVGDDRVKRGQELPEAKSVSRTYTTYKNLGLGKEVKSLVRNLSEEVGWKLREMGMAGRTFGLSVRGEQRGNFQRTTVKHCVEDGGEIFDITWKLFMRMRWGAGVRFAGVWAGNLIANSKFKIQNLLPEIRKREAINAVMDGVNNRFGYFSLYPGRLLGNEQACPEPNGYLGDKKFQLKP